ncbi:hypothetical protein [Wenxinia saemankumensis]|uniref:Glycosyl hydrolases family 38 N-terminal domain-containing protein n=1 Tax=Wenxinia saemankumensis TaxID=1447782 RepID=A0A1M5ZY79_9RHOB|nr:hypothetical protein [Wenxinia saemankumensis]SHI28989.1 Glycosyl hydrolases family 38 N-terminal domain-containing protein [Wenxinia saemankumensis]
MAIQDILLINHTHTDIGYTDYADTLFRHQRRIIDDALDLVEAESHRPDEARFRWTCEVSAITADWFRHASDGQKDRFRGLYADGLVDAAAMPVHWTPLISPANALRSLKHLRLLKDEGLDPKVAMQCDVNGLGWFWTDILIDLGIEGFLLESNPHRGMHFDTMQRIFDWRSPSGRDLFTYHGWHYSTGTNTFYLGNDDPEHTQATIDRTLARLEERGGYPYSAVIMPVTNKAAPDNGFATRGLSEFVERWNGEGRTPRMRICTVTEAMRAIRRSVEAEGTPLPVHAGDWSDYWVDGVGSTAYETVVARQAERLLPAVDFLTAFTKGGDDSLLDRAADELQWYDEHTWGAYNTHADPDSPFARMQLSWKTHRAHHGFALALEAASTESRRRAHEVADGAVEGDHILRRVNGKGERRGGNAFDPGPVEEHGYYVANPSSYPRRLYWPVPADHAGSAPQTILDAHSSDRFLTGMQTRKEQSPSTTHVLVADLPPFSEAVVRPVHAPEVPGMASGEGWIESPRWRLEIDPRDGAIRSLVDKETGRDCVAPDAPLGRMIYESLPDPSKDRFATFGGDYDWSRMETIRWPEGTEFERATAAKVTLETAKATPMGIALTVHLSWPHGDAARITYRLPAEGDGIEVDAMLFKTPVTAPDSVYMLFGAPGRDPSIHLDVGDAVIDVAREQIPFSCEAWIGIQRFAAIGTDGAALTVASPDAPLVQPFGIQTGNVGSGRQGNDPLLAFWLTNNHWDTNFPIVQSGGIPFRFRLLPRPKLDLGEAARFAELETTPPVIVRAYDSEEKPPRALVELDGPVTVTARVRKAPAGSGLMLSLNNAGPAATVSLSMPSREIGSVRLARPDGAILPDTQIDVSPRLIEIPPRATIHVLLD